MRDQAVSMFGKKWTDRFIEMAALISTWSKDPSTKVGAVVVDSERRIVSLGFNGFPRHVHDDAVRYEDKKVKYSMIVHAEANAIVSASASLLGKAMVATKSPCSECTKLIIQSGITTVIAPAPDREGKWADDHMFSDQMLREAGVTVETWSPGGVIMRDLTTPFDLLTDDQLRDVAIRSVDPQKISMALEIGIQRKVRDDLGPSWLSRGPHDHVGCVCKTHSVGMPELCDKCDCRSA